VGATHSHTPENIMANFPGMKCVCPSNAYDAKGLMKAAIRDNDPVMFMESTKLYGEEWDVPSNDELPDGELIIPSVSPTSNAKAPTSPSSPMVGQSSLV
jgi:pyruvate dehydrogenase E1 component beta subunit